MWRFAALAIMVVTLVCWESSIFADESKNSGLDTQWGPDGAGYVAKDPASGGEAYNWYDITTTGTEIWSGEDRDNDWTPMALLPFTFPFYDANYDSFSISADMIIKFTSAIVPNVVPVPSTFLRIDPWVYNMYHLGSASHYYYQPFGDSLFIVSFHDSRYYNPTYRNDPAYGKTLQVLLWSNGKIKFQYNTLNSIVAGSPSASGIDDAGPYGLSVGSSYSNGLAITFYSPYPRLSGNYDVGGGNNDFASPVAAATALQSHGVSGSVTFNIFDGTYNGQVNLSGTIFGLSATNTVTFQSAPGDHPVITSTSGHGFNITGADYIIIAGLEITSCFYNGFQILGSESDSSKYLSIVDNFIHNIGNYGGYDFAGIYFIYAADCHVLGNRIEVNSQGIYSYYGTRNTIANNTIFTSNQPLGRFGIGAEHESECQILQNEISGSEYGWQEYGIYSQRATGIAVCNNIVCSPSEFGIEDDLGISNGYYYNSVYNTGQAAFVLFVTTNNTVKNNIFYQGGSGNKYAIIITPGTSATSDFNNLYAPNSYVGSWVVARQTLTDWQAASDLDSNSISADPEFLRLIVPFDLHITATSPVIGAGTTITGINDDFDGEDRDLTAPDIGADEYYPPTGPPPAIEDLVITLSGDTTGMHHVTLSWSSIPGAHQYHIYKSTTSPTSGFTLMGSTPDTTYTDTNAIIGESKSFYYITADNAPLDNGISGRPFPNSSRHAAKHRGTP